MAIYVHGSPWLHKYTVTYMGATSKSGKNLKSQSSHAVCQDTACQICCFHSMNNSTKSVILILYYLKHPRRTWILVIRGFSLFHLTSCQMACMIDFAATFLESFLILVSHVLFCYMNCFTPQCISNTSRTD